MAGLLSPAAGGFFAAPRIDNLITSADVLRSKKPGSYLNGSISSYNPSVFDKAEQKIAGLLSYVLPQKEAAKLAHKAASFANDFTPAGDAVSAAQAGADFRQGNILSGLGNTAIAAIGVVPGVGDVAAKGIKKGIRAYHGSPHDFDRFSLSKIGTGEGAQSYGHGLYFAENKDVAKEYQEQLGRVTQGRAVNGQRFTYGTPDWVAADLASMVRGNEADVIKDYGSVDAWARSDLGARGMLDKADQILPRFKEFAGTGVETPWQKGHMYEVNINADPDSLLDWDKPFGAQSPQIIDGLAQVAKRNDIYDSFDPKRIVYEPEMPGASVYQRLRQGEGRPDAVAPLLRDAGIPGLKYLDQGSRATGAGSRNFVIFDDSIIDILNKY